MTVISVDINSTKKIKKINRLHLSDAEQKLIYCMYLATYQEHKGSI